jgi:hypothetical protein
MMWSFSAHATFRRCPRQWFFKRIFANARANDPLRREAYRLSKLEGIQSWRGKIVDTVISNAVISSISFKRPISLEQAKRAANEISARQQAERLAPKSPDLGDGQSRFFELEYGLPLTTTMFQKATEEIYLALENLYSAMQLWSTLTTANGLMPQRALAFRHGDITVQVVPDLIVLRPPDHPVLIDWKVNARPMRDYRLQLIAGAIALTRCTPHRDWPGAISSPPHEIELLEVQLLEGDIRQHRFSSAEVEEAEDFISASATEMLFAIADEDAGHLKPEDVPVASDPRICQTCSFRKLCWGAVT